MPIRKPRPTSPGRRFVSYPDFAEVTRSEPEKSLIEGLRRSGGRNAYGRKTSRHRGGGAKRAYRRVDFKRPQGRRVGARVGGDRVRPQPLRPHRACCSTWTARRRYILAPERSEGRRG